MKKLKVTVEGKTYEVSVEVFDDPNTTKVAAPVISVPVSTPVVSAPISAPAAAAPAAAASGPGDVPSPLTGKVVEISAQVGQQVTAGQQLVTLEAMKMNTYVNAHKAGTVKAILITVGQGVEEGQALITIE